MINIYSSGKQITYTAGDTFELSVLSESEFDSGAILKFQVAKNEESELLIDTSFNLNESGFIITLNDEEKEILTLGEYIYKIVLISASGDIITQKSGELIVKWGV